MEQSRPHLRKDVISRVAPCRFVSKAKRQLEEVREMKNRIIWLDKEMQPEECSEYFRKIEAAFEDQGSLEWLRVRSLVRDCFKATEKEVQEHVKEILSSSEQSSSSLLRADSPSSRSRSAPPKTRKPLTSVRFHPSVASKQGSTNRETTFNRAKPKPTSVGNAVPKELSAGLQWKQSSTGLIRNSSFQERNAKDDLISTESLLLKVQKYCPLLTNKKRLDLQKEKYFPCAVPLSKPCRKKPVAFSGFEEEDPPDQPSALNNSSNVLLVNVDCGRVHKPSLVEQKLPSIDIEGKPFRPRIINNTCLVSVIDNSPPTMVEDKSTAMSPTAEMDPLPFIHAAVQVDESDDQNDTSDNKLKGSVSQSRNTRFDPEMLSQIIAAIRKSDSSAQSEESKQNTIEKSTMNITGEQVVGDQNDLNIGPTPSMMSAEVQANLDEERHISLVSESVQVVVQAIEKDLQTEVPQSECSVQTDLQGLDIQLVTRDQQSSHSFICCDNISDAPSKVSTDVRTSTPVSDIGHGNQVGLACDTTPLEKTGCGCSIGKDCVNTSVSISISKTNDIGVQCSVDAECQTLPEMCDAAVQEDGGSRDFFSTAEINKQKVDADVLSNPGVMHDSDDDDDRKNSVIDSKDAGIQYEMHDVSSGSATLSNATVSDSEFMDDLLSEGEVPLPWNLRLLSMIDRSGIRTFQTSSSNGESGNHLSEGEIPPGFLHQKQEASSPGSSGSSVFPSTSGTSQDTLPKLLRLAAHSNCLNRSYGQVLTSSSFTSSGEKSSSDLLQPSCSDLQSISEGELPFANTNERSVISEGEIFLPESIKPKGDTITKSTSTHLQSSSSSFSVDSSTSHSSDARSPLPVVSCSLQDAAADFDAPAPIPHSLSTVIEEASGGSSSVTQDELSEKNRSCCAQVVQLQLQEMQPPGRDSSTMVEKSSDEDNR